VRPSSDLLVSYVPPSVARGPPNGAGDGSVGSLCHFSFALM
jgi:hypothetical protein